MRLWHFTCDHGARGIRATGDVRPVRMVGVPERIAAMDAQDTAWMLDLAWFTEDRRPPAGELGLTSPTLRCNRMKHRFRVTGPGPVPWLGSPFERAIPSDQRALLHHLPAEPALWWVSDVPVRVRL